jgi:FkbM family methyltransferase
MTSRSLATGNFVMRIRPAPLAVLVKWLLCVRRMELSTPEGKFWVDTASYQGNTLARHGVYEPDLLATVKSHLKAGGTFVDVGANEGYFSVIAARCVGPAGRVLAIEPQARLQRVLRRNFTLNSCDRVTLVAAAVSDHTGEASLHLTPGVNNSASSLMQPTRYPLFRQTVPTLRLADILDQAGIETCDLMKIDIESWEYEAVLGSKELFRSGRVRALALELHPPLLAARGLDSAELMRFLSDCGYREVPGLQHLLLIKS